MTMTTKPPGHTRQTAETSALLALLEEAGSRLAHRMTADVHERVVLESMLQEARASVKRAQDHLARVEWLCHYDLAENRDHDEGNREIREATRGVQERVRLEKERDLAC